LTKLKNRIIIHLYYLWQDNQRQMFISVLQIQIYLNEKFLIILEGTLITRIIKAVIRGTLFFHSEMKKGLISLR